MQANVWCLVNFFNKKEHADEIVAGNLYLNRLSYFRTLEQCEDVLPTQQVTRYH
jgi:hypothetical protein